MTHLAASIVTSLPIDQAFDFIADFANSSLWDPGVATSARAEVNDSSPLGVGTRFKLGVRMRGRVAPMEYRITSYDRPVLVILAGTGSNISATDSIRFTALPDGTRIEYVADIRLGGWMRLVEPFAGGAFRTLASNALNGMQRALDARAGARSAKP
jgi:Polyketide cyclase / dehydrase and lipid transport